MEIQELQLKDNHQEITSRFIAACRADERILAAFLGGSYAKGKTDEFSDLDLFFVTTDEAYEDFLAEKESFVHLLGEPLFLEDFGVRHGYCVIFSNGTEGDIWFGRQSKFNDIYSGPYRILLDKVGILDGKDFPPFVADQVEQTGFLQQQLDWFWHELSHFIKAMGRRQLWFAYGQLEAMRQICVALARLRRNFSDKGAVGEPYFKVERALPVEELSALQATFCPMEHEAMLQAGRVICRFYQEVAPNLAAAHGLAYQTDLERMMMSQVNNLG